MASAEFDDDSAEKRPTVQVGDPFTEKLLIEACLELMATDAIVAIQDMGAAGLTCSTVEMASKGEVGIELDLDQVPVRETGMTAYEIMLSESQERMLLVLKPGAEDAARAIFEKWELDFAIVGKVTEGDRLVLRQDGQVIADIPVPPLVEESPDYERPYTTPPPPAELPPLDISARPAPCKALARLMGCPDLASRRWIWEQYDHMVMADTVQRPGGDAAVVRVHGTEKGLAITTDCTPRYCAADPVQGGRQAVAEAWRNLTAVGARPLAVTDNLNFGNPERPEIMGQIVSCIEGIADACQTLDFPVVSGNVSLYNETNGKAILPTPAIGAVGVLDRAGQSATIAFKAAGEEIVLVGETLGHIGASLYAREIAGTEAGAPPPVDLAVEKRNGDLVRSLITDDEVTACHDLSDGGLLVALAEMALAGYTGADIDVPSGAADPDRFLFGEDQARYLLTAPNSAEILGRAADAGVPTTVIGRTGGTALTVGGGDTISLAQLSDVHEGWLPRYMAGD